jgi:hypothetical protein
MAATLKSTTRVGAVSRRSVAVRASAENVVSRRVAFGAVLGGLAALATAEQAQAVRIPSQEFTGGLVSGGGALPKSSTLASAEGYSLETGIKKPAISPSKKKALLADAKKKALAAAS